MESMHSLYLHPGLEKTGTTSLQKIFSDMSIDYFGRNYKLFFRRPDLFTKFRRLVLEQGPNWWSSTAGVNFTKSQSKLKKKLESFEFKNLLVSYENLLVHDLFFDKNYWFKSDGNKSWTPIDHLKIFLEIMYPAFGEINLLITVRRQPEWLGSLYSQRSNRILNASQKNFDAYIKKIFETTEIFPPLNLEGLVKEIKLKLPIKNVTLLPIELMGTVEYSKEIIKWLPNNFRMNTQVTFETLNRRNAGSNCWKLRPKQTYLRKSLPIYGGFVENFCKSSRINDKNLIYLSNETESLIMSKVADSNKSVVEFAPIGLPNYY